MESTELKNIFGGRNPRPEAVTSTPEEIRRRAAGILRFLLGIKSESDLEGPGPTVQTDWYDSGENEVSIERAGRKEHRMKDNIDEGVVDENRFHSSDATTALQTKGLAPCQRRKGSIHS